MSTENLNKFQALVANDPGLQSRVVSAHQAAARESAEKIAALAAETGAPFTPDEFLAQANSRLQELSDEQLDAVAGGRGVSTEFKVFMSIISVGIACAVIAIDSQASRGDAARCI